MTRPGPAFSTLRDHFAEQYTDIGILLGAASGIDLMRGSDRAGPHVGSYHNMLFKRALLESGAPLAVFGDEDKLPRPALSGQYFLVCDDRFQFGTMPATTCRQHCVQVRGAGTPTISQSFSIWAWGMLNVGDGARLYGPS